MQRAGATAANVLRRVFPLVLLLCLAVSGCGKTCFSGFFNGSASGVKFSNSSCPFTKATAGVIVQMVAPSAPPIAFAAFPPPLASPLASPSPSLSTSLSESIGALTGAFPRALPNNVQHIFVALRGIEAHPDTVADEDSPGWQELAPELATHPVQLDLLALPPPLAPLAPLTPSAALAPLAPFTLTGDSGSLDVPASANDRATVPADEYRQLRLRLLPRNPSPDDPIPESNACGNVGWNCIVFANRSAEPLEFVPSEFAAPTWSGPSAFHAAQVRPSASGPDPEFRIPPEPGTGNLFRVLPGEVIHLSIEFDPASSVYFASNAAVRLVPVFRVVSRRSWPAPTDQ